MNGTELLAAYKQSGSEDAFSQLVRRYTNLVYSIAKRRVSNGPLAEEVTQSVFTRLAAAAPKVRGDAELVAWLHRTTVHVAIDVWRSETRRRTREQHAAVMEPVPAESTPLWAEIAPNLDESLNQLSAADRHAVLLRFFDQKPMRDIGRILGVSEDAAKMRVSRAIDRLRTQLAGRGVTCTAVALGMVLAERSIEAAPSHLVASLRSIKLPASAGAAGIAGILSALLHTSRSKVITGVVALCVGIGVIALFRSTEASPRNDTIKPKAIDSPYVLLRPSGARVLVNRPAANLPAVETTGTVRLRLRVVDAETELGLAGAKVKAVYFYAGGVGEGHELMTDEYGNAAVPESDKPANHGMNLFVSAEGYVPKSMQFNRSDAEYTMRLDRGLTVSGTVVDEQGQSVEGVKIQVQTPAVQGNGPDSVDLQTSAVFSDSDGRWLCTFIPGVIEEIRFVLTRDDYAVTLPVVPVGKVDLRNLVLVIDRGFTVTGRVTDLEGQPIAGAAVKELNNTGYRRQSTLTYADGTFALQGLLSEYEFYRQRPNEANANGTLRIRGMAGIGEPHGVRVLVQADGFAPQTPTVQLLEPTNVVNFTLAQGNIFRGRVLDQAGNPIPDAVVRTDTDNQGLDKFKWQTRTDAEGRFEWDSAPAEPVLFWFEADGYNWLRDVPLVADGSVHEIKLAQKTTE